MKQLFYAWIRFFYRWPQLFCLFLIKLYQVFLSAHFGGACRFSPSCSHYAEKAVLSYPLPRALRLIVKRLSRCHFFGSFGPDPLPQHRGAKTIP